MASLFTHPRYKRMPNLLNDFLFRTKILFDCEKEILPIKKKINIFIFFIMPNYYLTGIEDHPPILIQTKPSFNPDKNQFYTCIRKLKLTAPTIKY